MRLTNKIIKRLPLASWKGHEVRTLYRVQTRDKRNVDWPLGTTAIIEHISRDHVSGLYHITTIRRGTGERLESYYSNFFELVQPVLECLTLEALMTMLPPEGERIVCEYENVSFPVVRSSDGAYRCFAFSGSINTRVINLNPDRVDPDFSGSTPQEAVIAMLAWLKEEQIITY
jgi:hypothetical protein